MIGLAFGVAYRSTQDLYWPNEYDLYREIASARSLLQEGFGHDPYYRGESVWYNPLTHTVLAGLHRVTGLPLPILAARSGPYLNLLAPIAFFLLLWLLFNGWIALLALVGFLFCIGGAFPSWAAATYSPWLYPVNFTQGFFYLAVCLLALLRNRSLTVGWGILSGIALGIVFLGHTAPALLLAGIFAVLLIDRYWKRRASGFAEIYASMPGLLSMAVLFSVVIFPFARSIIGHYGLHVINDVPNGYVPDFLGYRNIPLMIWRHVDFPVLVGWVGLYSVIKGPVDPFVRRLLLAWTTLTLVALCYGYLVVGAAKVGIHLPPILPSYHALFYFKAALAILFALGLVALSKPLASRIARKQPRDADLWMHGLSLGFALLLLVWEAPHYLKRYDYSRARDEALGHAAEQNRIAVYDWARANATSDDVFLASDDLGLFGIAPAGAKVVAVNPYFSNPYIDWSSRARDRDRMFAALNSGAWQEFSALARDYRVTYVADASSGAAIAPGFIGSQLEEVLAAGTVRVYRVVSK